ncbi:MAG: CoB--CoM heterodisulfide reductase subunit B [Candidatus Jordarchaeaceae archaeon]
MRRSRYAYFLGCLTPNRYPGIEAATKDVLNFFDIDVLEMNGASCCPAPGVFGSFDLLTWLTIAARNLTIAEGLGANIVVTCNGCFGTLQEANHMLKSNKELREQVNQLLAKIGREYKGKVDVVHVVEVLRNEVGLERISDSTIQPLTGVKVGVHYGCHFLKPSETRQKGNPETPVIMEELISAVDAVPLEYKDKLMCCGAGGGVRAAKIDVALDFTKEKIDNMLAAGADCVCTPCAFCHFQFDAGQQELNAKLKNGHYNLPVIFITQLVGLGLGISPVRMGLYDNKTQVQTLLDKIRGA